MPPAATPLWIVDALKAIASQLIIWHHFVLYGPMSGRVYPYAERLIDWLYEDGRLAVQAFLVTGGFLAARALAPRPHLPAFDATATAIARLLWRRYLRLTRPYFVALLLAIVFAALARQLLDDPDTPAAPSLGQVLAHVFLLHDIVAVDALSVGVWYVAIDFQLYTVFALLLWLSQRLGNRIAVPPRTLSLLLLTGLIALALLWINRNPALDEWAPYFFGAYGLGIMVQWSSGLSRKHFWSSILAGVVMLALVVEWRSQLVVAVASALLLAIGIHLNGKLEGVATNVVAWLGRISYAVFLIHYPICLLVGAVVGRWWPDRVAINLAGLLAAWLLTLAGGTALQRWVERRPRAEPILA